MVDLNYITRRFLLNETPLKPTIKGIAESVYSILEMIRPRTQKESRQISIAKQHIHEIQKLNRRLEEKVRLLEEKVQVLEEGK